MRFESRAIHGVDESRVNIDQHTLDEAGDGAPTFDLEAAIVEDQH